MDPSPPAVPVVPPEASASAESKCDGHERSSRYRRRSEPRILEPLCGPRAALPERPISHRIQVAYAEGPTALPRVSIEGHPINHTFSDRKVVHTLLRGVARPLCGVVR